MRVREGLALLSACVFAAFGGALSRTSRHYQELFDFEADAANLHELPTTLAAEDTVSHGTEPVGSQVTDLTCPGSVKYGYDKLKALGGCLPKEKSEMGPFSDFKVTPGPSRRFFDCDANSGPTR